MVTVETGAPWWLKNFTLQEIDLIFKKIGWKLGETVVWQKHLFTYWGSGDVEDSITFKMFI